MHKFNELYVISDTHFGGEKSGGSNFQVFDRGDRLSAFVNHITESNPNNEVALVINGDLIDSLAEPDINGYVALDENAARKMMQRLYNDPSFKVVWDSLGAFIKTENRHLIILLGNHDIELALPVVEQSMRHHLAGDSGDVQARLHFYTHGTGYRCAVGSAEIYCTHGNEYDDWNWVDQHKLSQLANAMSSGRSVPQDDWTPNAGTRLVVDVMNHVKKRFPFVDALKPETAAIAAVLLSLDTELFKKVDLRSALPIFRSKRRGKAMTSRILSVDGTDGLGDIKIEPADLSQILGANLSELIESESSESDSLKLAIDALDSDDQLEGIDDSIEVLGWSDIVAGVLRLKSEHEALRHALKDWVKDGKTFDPLNEDDDYFKHLQDKVGNDIDFVITGHTHLCRSLPMHRGAHYFNTGTWIRLLKFTVASVNDKDAFKDEIWPALRSGRMEDLDTLNIASDEGGKTPLRYDRTNTVHICEIGRKVTGTLYQVEDDGDGQVKLKLEPHTKTVEAR